MEAIVIHRRGLEQFRVFFTLVKMDFLAVYEGKGRFVLNIYAIIERAVESESLPVAIEKVFRHGQQVFAIRKSVRKPQCLDTVVEQPLGDAGKGLTLEKGHFEVLGCRAVQEDVGRDLLQQFAAIEYSAQIIRLTMRQQAIGHVSEAAAAGKKELGVSDVCEYLQAVCCNRFQFATVYECIGIIIGTQVAPAL